MHCTLSCFCLSSHGTNCRLTRSTMRIDETSPWKEMWALMHFGKRNAEYSFSVLQVYTKCKRCNHFDCWRASYILSSFRKEQRGLFLYRRMTERKRAAFCSGGSWNNWCRHGTYHLWVNTVKFSQGCSVFDRNFHDHVDCKIPMYATKEVF